MNIIETVRDEIKKEIRTAKLPVILVYLYGSYAKGMEKVGSDIDIAVLLKEDAYSKNPLGAVRSLQGIAMRIEKSIKKEVDVRILNRSSLSFSYVVITTGIPIYMSSKTAFHNYQNKILGMFFDFKPFFERYISTYVGI